VLDASVAYDALLARDPRFDGVFYVAVTTTGIYCRPICPARTPAKARCEFYPSAAQAEHAGFRACFRCRPELAPGKRGEAAPCDAVDVLVARAAHRIAEGALNDASIELLADELGVTARHLRRVIEARLGVTPVELAQTHRLALAKQLLHDTALPLTDIAFASGFGSVRRFNALFRARMGSPPSQVRRSLAPAGDGATLRLDARAPYDAARLVGFLAGRAIPGVEHVEDGVYRRVVHVGGATGTIAVRANPARAGIVLSLSPALVPVAMPVVARVRRLFDLDARPDVIASVLGRDRALAPLVRARPGLRVPGALEAFEAAVRALLGQQVSVAAASTLAGRFAARFGTALTDAAVDAPVRVRFPTAAEVARASVDAIAAVGLPRTRAEAIRTLAAAIASGQLDLDTPRDLDRAIADLVALPGVGPWTAHYLAMRALHLPDAFPAGDLVLRRAVGIDGTAAVTARAEAWRPFRAYAALHLWTHHAESDS
jgi:AraC family transcriptional regulator of adaptative response / DNA-3-methyladenine glycosylase II